MNNFRTDMADERVAQCQKDSKQQKLDGIKVQNMEKDGMNITIVDVLNEKGSQLVDKTIGRYITMQIKDIEYLEEAQKQKSIQKLAELVLNLIGNDSKKSVMVVGLGNLYVTPDCLGPKVVQNINVTRHLLKFAKDLVDPTVRQISAISPGVLGTTGIETSEIVTSVVNNVKPDIVIVIDSLMSQSIDRIGCSIQLSNTGIVPGAGVRNRRMAINQEILNVPVIAIGVPTVVDVATITNYTIEKLEQSNKIKINLDKNNSYKVLADVLNTENYIVTPKEIDEIMQKVSEIISSALNVAL